MNALTQARKNAECKVKSYNFARNSHAQVAFQYFGYIECGHTPAQAEKQLMATVNPITVAKVMRVINGK